MILKGLCSLLDWKSNYLTNNQVPKIQIWQQREEELSRIQQTLAPNVGSCAVDLQLYGEYVEYENRIYRKYENRLYRKFWMVLCFGCPTHITYIMQ